MQTSYTIQAKLLNRLHQELTPFLAEHSSLFVIADTAVLKHYHHILEQEFRALDIPYTLYPFKASENNKSLKQAEACWHSLQNASADRKTLVLALGGGITTDLTGWVAANYMRGISTIYIPTTLMGMVDAALGGKTAINFGGTKNAIGSFHQPLHVFIDPHTLHSLPKRFLKAGLAEVIKYGVIQGPSLFESIIHWIPDILSLDPKICCAVIEACCRVKNAIVEKDHRDRSGKRAILNFGHTFAHAIEAAFPDERYLHGEAVAIGMHIAAELSVFSGHAEPTLITTIDDACRRAGLSTKRPPLCEAQWLKFLYRDKKCTKGKITCILAQDLGKVFAADSIDELMILKTLRNTCLMK